MTYDEWMREVDAEVQGIAMVSVHDLPDFLSRDSFDMGDTPAEGARIALEGADFPFDDE
jgi:hypothetical protein